MNALHRVGVFGNTHGMRLDELVPEASTVLDAFLTLTPQMEEVERPSGMAILFRCIPLIEARAPSGALVLLRDVSDLRHRDRLLLSKDATIREIHHRVKNNLQTISSLLSLQARRMAPGEGKAALNEAERRIRSIAVVHEILSQEAGDQIPFGEAISALVAMAEDTTTSGDPVRIEVKGDAGSLPADLATPLSLIFAELLQNAVEHAFPSNSTEGTLQESKSRDRPPVGNLIVVELENDGKVLAASVMDNGVGISDGFQVGDTQSLGLLIVRDLVVAQLNGEIDILRRGDWGGTEVSIRIPVDRTELAD